MAYRRAPYTEGGDLTEYLQRELENIENEFNRIAGGFAFTLLKAEPPKPRLGQVVLADGVNWNPLLTEEPSLVTFNGTDWAPATGAESISWTPSLTCVTPGDLAVTYGGGAQDRVGLTLRVGNLVHLRFRLRITNFTHSTASGSVIVTGFPFTLAAPNTLGVLGVQKISGTVNWPTGTTHLYCGLDASNKLTLQAVGTNTDTSLFTVTNFVSGSSFRIFGNITYSI